MVAKIIGCTLGTSIACAYATMNYGWRELTIIVPRHNDLLDDQIWFMDDMTSIVDNPTIPPGLTAEEEYT